VNSQLPVRRQWKDIEDELRAAIHNTEIQLELLKAQLKEAQAHIRG